MAGILAVMISGFIIWNANATGFTAAEHECRIVILVTDEATKQVVENAQINVEPGGLTLKTNAEGMAEIQVPHAGVYVLYVSAAGYDRMQALKVNVGENQSAGISTALRGNTVVGDSDSEAPNDGSYALFMDSLPSVKGGMEALARIVVYPEFAQVNRMEGTVFVRTYVSETGVVVKAVVEKTAGVILDRAALTAVMKVNFEPAKQKGRSVKSVVTLPIKFRLGN